MASWINHKEDSTFSNLLILMLLHVITIRLRSVHLFLLLCYFWCRVAIRWLVIIPSVWQRLLIKSTATEIILLRPRSIKHHPTISNFKDIIQQGKKTLLNTELKRSIVSTAVSLKSLTSSMLLTVRQDGIGIVGPWIHREGSLEDMWYRLLLVLGYLVQNKDFK